MAHNLARIGGKVAMMYQGETPWHRLGTRLDGVTSVEAAMEAASLNWNVGLQEMFLADQREVPNKRAVVRDIDGAILGTVSRWYEPIQNRDAFGIFQPAIDEFGLTVEAAGALGSGERVWMLCRLPETSSVVPGDDVRGYCLISTGHDGGTGLDGLPTPIRVVCQNTLNWAMGKDDSKNRLFKIAHSGDVTANIKAATKMVRDVIAAMQVTGETFATMARQRLTPEQVIGYIESVFPAEKDGTVKDATMEKRGTVAELVWRGVGADLAMSMTDGQPNPWALYNAVTEYFDHLRRENASAASIASADRSSIFGSAADLKLFALQRARQLVSA